ncbi:MAG: hypothetical protein LBM28_01700 [Oscillospiraceae bacterium]|jgi:hypothetical protein|nr:hypothetical protein [Oscillospiraceae bacterium]
MTINTHGLKMTGLRKAAGETKCLRGAYDAGYVQISFDTATGEVLSDYHYDLGHNSHTRYHEDTVINCGTISVPTTMQGIADMIREAAWYENQRRAEWDAQQAFIASFS